MSASHVPQGGAFLTTLFVLFALAVLLAPRTVRAEPLLLLYKADSSNITTWHETIRPYAKQPTLLSLNGNGDLVVKCGAINVVMAYNAPEELHKQQEPVRLAMATNQEAPAPGGISVRFNISF